MRERIASIAHRLYRYVGPPEIAAHARGGPPGDLVGGPEDVAAVRRRLGARSGEVTFTYVVDDLGRLRLSDRHAEHVACAAGRPVMAAGEITFVGDATVERVSNQSTGFCPEVSSWPALAHALDAAGITQPGAYTDPVELRRCVACEARVLVKDRDYACPECGRALPAWWNLDRTRCARRLARVGGADWVVDTVEEAAAFDHDRVGVFEETEGLLLALADGTGGAGHARAAAEAVIEEVAKDAHERSALVRDLPDELLIALDRRIARETGGQTTAVVVALTDAGARGASVGDSSMYCRETDRWRESTAHQARRPLLGSGRAVAVTFVADAAPDALLLASDGLTRHADASAFLTLIDEAPADLGFRLIDLVRLPNGKLQDDVSMVLARRTMAG